jgi:hypothetical protein
MDYEFILLVKDALHLVDALVDLLFDLPTVSLTSPGWRSALPSAFRSLFPVVDGFFRFPLHLICLSSHFLLPPSTWFHAPDP